MRSNPLDNTSAPGPWVVLAVGGAALAALSIGGFTLRARVAQVRAENV